MDLKSAAVSLKDWSKTLLEFLGTVVRKYSRDRCSVSAGSLTLTTLFSLVPLTALMVSIFSLFSAFQDLGRHLQEFIVENFVPSTGQVVQQYLLRFVEQSSRIQLIGIVSSAAIVFFLIREVDRILNDIWHVTKSRSGTRSFILYWTLLTVGPIFMGLSIVLTSYFSTLPVLSGIVEEGTGPRVFRTLIPFFLTASALTIMYTVVPRRRVRLFSAAVAALIAATLFELVKRAFASYVTQIHTYEVVFGAMAALPLFLLWLYLSWSVVLFGAETAYCLGVYRRGGSHRAMDPFTASYRLIRHFFRAHVAGESLRLTDLLKIEPDIAEENLIQVLAALVKAELLAELEDGSYLLKRDLGRVTLAQFYRILPWRLPDPNLVRCTPADGPFMSAFVSSLEGAETVLDESLTVPLGRLFAEQA